MMVLRGFDAAADSTTAGVLTTAGVVLATAGVLTTTGVLTTAGVFTTAGVSAVGMSAARAADPTKRRFLTGALEGTSIVPPALQRN